MRYDEAIRAPDRDKFLKAMTKEVAEHEEFDHLVLNCRSVVPKNKKVLPAVWAMRCKRRGATSEVYKHKARLNVGVTNKSKERIIGKPHAPLCLGSPFDSCLCCQWFMVGDQDSWILC